MFVLCFQLLNEVMFLPVRRSRVSPSRCSEMETEGFTSHFVFVHCGRLYHILGHGRHVSSGGLQFSLNDLPTIPIGEDISRRETQRHTGRRRHTITLPRPPSLNPLLAQAPTAEWWNEKGWWRTLQQASSHLWWRCRHM